jgi:hypothetical protein
MRRPVALLTGLHHNVLIEAGAGLERNEFHRVCRKEGSRTALAWRKARFKGNA